MKTTIEIPDELFREAKARAATEGIKLKDLVADALSARLRAPSNSQKRRARFPIIRNKAGSGRITDEMVNAAAEQMQTEDIEHYAQFMRR